MKALVINEMIWPEVKDRLSDIKLAVVPVGSCEQHGPNTTFETDTARAYSAAKMLGDRVGEKLLIFPPVTYGLSYHHMDFPCTVTLKVETMIGLLTDIAVAIHSHGIEKILFLNGHGGNKAALEAVVLKLKQEHDITSFWSTMGSEIIATKIEEYFDGLPSLIGHACEVETSQAMYLAPEVVRENRVPGEIQESLYTRDAFIPGSGNGIWNWKKDVTNNGALGDAGKATAEIGEKMTVQVLDYLEKLVDEIIAY